MMIFLDTEFTDLSKPELLSIGMVATGAVGVREHYVELDLEDAAGAKVARRAGDFAKYSGVLDQWGMVPGAATTMKEMGRRTGEWIIGLHSEAGMGTDRIAIAFDYSADYELFERVVRGAGLWDQVREITFPANVNSVTGTIDGELAAEESFRASSKSGLLRHHSLADARALMASYDAVKSGLVETFGVERPKSPKP